MGASSKSTSRLDDVIENHELNTFSRNENPKYFVTEPNDDDDDDQSSRDESEKDYDEMFNKKRNNF